MSIREVLQLLLLAAAWGGSYVFMRHAVPEFGAFALVALRTFLASVFLLPIWYARAAKRDKKPPLLPLLITGAANSALPFCLIAFSTLSLSAGFAAILNATSPFFAAMLAFFWFSQNLDRLRIAGMVTGFSGVILLLWDKTSIPEDGAALAVGAALIAAALYGFAANYAKKQLADIEPITIAAGSQCAAALMTAPFAWVTLPEAVPSTAAWLSAIGLGIVSTGIAYLLYFNLIARAGATNAMTVTFLIPVFAMLWGFLMLDEHITWYMIAATILIVIGSGLATGYWRLRSVPPASH